MTALRPAHVWLPPICARGFFLAAAVSLVMGDVARADASFVSAAKLAPCALRLDPPWAGGNDWV